MVVVWHRTLESDFGDVYTAWKGYVLDIERFNAWKDSVGWFFQDLWTATTYEVCGLSEVPCLANDIVLYEEPWWAGNDGWRSASGRFFAAHELNQDPDGGYRTYLEDTKTGQRHKVAVREDCVRRKALEIVNSELPSALVPFGGDHARWLRELKNPPIASKPPLKPFLRLVK